MHGFLLYHSRLEPLCRTSLHRFWRPRLLNRVGPHVVETHRRRLPRRFRGLLRLFTSRILTLLRVHALQLFSRAWPLLFCPTRDRHLLCPLFLLSVTATTGAVNVLAEASPPFLASCDTLRTSTRAPLWTRPLAPCSQRSNGSPARLPLVVASEEVELGSAIVVVRPVRLGLLGWETSLWAPSVLLPVVKTWPWSMLMLPPRPASPLTSPLVDLPVDFTQRIRALPSSTILHVPASCRLRMISVVARCWNGMAQGRDDYAQLEEGRSKFLLSTVPQGLSVATEVQKRLTLWKEQSFETLLQRAEEQLLLKRKAGKRRKSSGPSDPSERGDRARRTAAVGASWKATTGLVSSMLSFNEQEDMRWAQELLPTSNLGPSAHCDRHLAPPSCTSGVHLGQALLWFALRGSHCSRSDWDSS